MPLPRRQKPVYKGRQFYYKDPSDLKEEYSYQHNQPLGFGSLPLSDPPLGSGDPPLPTSVENYHHSKSYVQQKVYRLHKPREYPGVLD